jgi:hypothetical protein
MNESDYAEAETPTGAPKPTRLHCEYREQPLGSDITNPRLSWMNHASRDGGITDSLFPVPDFSPGKG